MWVRLAGPAPTFQWNARLSNVDVLAAAAFAGSPNTISGRLSGQVDLKGEGTDAATAMKTVAGTLRADVVDGVVKNLGLIRAVVAASSLDAKTVMNAASGSRDEPFSRLGGTLVIGGGQASTTDLRFESPDLTLSAAGHARLDGSELAFNGAVQLSEELSKQVVANAPVMKAAQEGGRVRLPATITGSASNPQVGIDTSTLATRAIRNTATEQSQKAVKKGIDRLLK
jgi:AsmA protein